MTDEICRDGVGGNEAAKRCETLAEGGHNQVDILGDTHLVAETLTVGAKDTHTVGFVYHNGSFIFLCKGNDIFQGSCVAFHTENAVHYNEFDLVALALAQLALKVSHVVVAELEIVGGAEAAALYDRCVVTLVQQDIVVAAAKAADYTQVYLETGREDNGFVLAHKLGKTLFGGFVYIKGSVKETGTGTA